jgi:hypothetical protein
MTTSLWEILVPTEKTKNAQYEKELAEHTARGAVYSPNMFYTTRYHKVWDEKVRAITGGLTIMTPAKGQWVSPDGKLFQERMIPVRIVAKRNQIHDIIDMTMEYYDQQAILCYKLSDEVIIRHRGSDVL